MDSLTDAEAAADTVVDAEGGTLMPSWCDPHTHIVYAGSREGEFVDKIRGLSYAEIAKRGGGILNSADLLHTMTEDQLYEQAMRRVREVMMKGTGCVEIKSGYGLNTEDELKMLRVIRRIKETAPIKVVSTFLGAHAVGRQYTQDEYVRLVVEEMIPEVGREHLADYVDVFCDEGFFTPEETDRILEAGAKWGMLPKDTCRRTGIVGRRRGRREAQCLVCRPSGEHDRRGDRVAARQRHYAYGAARHVVLP